MPTKEFKILVLWAVTAPTVNQTINIILLDTRHLQIDYKQSASPQPDSYYCRDSCVRLLLPRQLVTPPFLPES